MQIIQTIADMRAWARKTRASGQSIGFVPTMGCLHAGHLSLMHKSLETCSATVVSIFLNPAQFGPNEDLHTYPVSLDEDKRQLQSLGVDVLFLPRKQDIYPPGYKTFIHVEDITERLCGSSRPDFFTGVATVVLKLLNIVQPDRVFFGEKDRQQLTVVNTLVRDLDLDIEVVGLAIVREPDGLALSSRNLYLNGEDRQSALSLNRALETAKDLVHRGESSADKVRATLRAIIEQEKNTRIDYISVCDPGDFRELNEIRGETLIALAVHVGEARLIDNCLIARE